MKRFFQVWLTVLVVLGGGVVVYANIYNPDLEIGGCWVAAGGPVCVGEPLVFWQGNNWGAPADTEAPNGGWCGPEEGGSAAPYSYTVTLYEPGYYEAYVQVRYDDDPVGLYYLGWGSGGEYVVGVGSVEMNGDAQIVRGSGGATSFQAKSTPNEGLPLNCPWWLQCYTDLDGVYHGTASCGVNPTVTADWTPGMYQFWAGNGAADVGNTSAAVTIIPRVNEVSATATTFIHQHDPTSVLLTAVPADSRDVGMVKWRYCFEDMKTGNETGWTACGNGESITFAFPQNATPGWYYVEAKAWAGDTAGKQITLTVLPYVNYVFANRDYLGYGTNDVATITAYPYPENYPMYDMKWQYTYSATPFQPGQQLSWTSMDETSVSVQLTGYWGPGYYMFRAVNGQHGVDDDWWRYSQAIAVISVDIDAVSDAPRGNEQLTDNREGTVALTVYPDMSGLAFSVNAVPKSTGTLINKGGTGIQFTATPDPKVWRMSKTYWYGVQPLASCEADHNAYTISVSVNGHVAAQKDFRVGWPNEKPEIVGVMSATSTTVIHPAEAVPGIPNSYRCLIEFGDFIKDAIPYGLPTSDQYAYETLEEEGYHILQWRGEVADEEGGQGDCGTAKGIKWAIGWVGNGPWYTYGTTPEKAYASAKERVKFGEAREYKTTFDIARQDRGFVEIKAKNFAGYNAAWTYHCCYEKEYGPNPVNYHHPAY